MKTVDHFRATMAERRKYRNARQGAEWDYLTRTARTLLLIVYGVPTTQWKEYGL